MHSPVPCSSIGLAASATARPRPSSTVPAAWPWSRPPSPCGTPSISAARRTPCAAAVPDALLAHLAPPGWQHITLTGDYLWGADTNLGPDGFRPLRGTSANPALIDAA